MGKNKIGLIGLGTMGSNLARNIADKGFSVSVYNRTTEVTESFINNFGSENLVGKKTLEEFMESLELPRKIILMVKAGKVVDTVIDQLKPLLDKRDIIIDCGNSNFKNTERRYKLLLEEGFEFMGCGVSGGEEGALNGPSLMPGGSKSAWENIKEIFEKIAAKDFDGEACVTYVGEGSAGHYVKMVHNGIEYGVMQLMAEAYDLLRNIYKLSPEDLAGVFEHWNNGPLSSYLFEISKKVLKQKDDKADGYLIDKILDKAAQKGTGKWTAIDSLDKGAATPTITEAVYARNISGNKSIRSELSGLYEKKDINSEIELEEFTENLEHGLFSAMLSTYAQGLDLINHVSQENNWNINLAEIARIWEGGCIIRAQILKGINEALQNRNLHLFKINSVVKELNSTIPALREVVAQGVKSGIPVPALSTALSYFDSVTNNNLPANFIQGLRDYFGAHTYERTDQEGTFHTEWN